MGKRASERERGRRGDWEKERERQKDKKKQEVEQKKNIEKEKEIIENDKWRKRKVDR